MASKPGDRRWLTRFDDAFLEVAVAPWIGKLCRWGIHPNALTVLALALSSSIPYFHVRGRTGLVVGAVLSRQVLDFLDGEIARRCGKVTRLGGVLDSFSDAVFFLSVLFVVASIFVSSPLTAFLLAASAFAGLFAVHVRICKGSALLDHDLRTYDTRSLYRRAFAFLINDSLIFAAAFALLYALASK